MWTNQRQKSYIKLKVQYLTNANKLDLPLGWNISLFKVSTYYGHDRDAARTVMLNQLFKINIFLQSIRNKISDKQLLSKDTSAQCYLLFHKWAQCRDLIFLPISYQISMVNIEIKCFISTTWPNFLSGCT